MMLDIKFIREHTEEVLASLRKRLRPQLEQHVHEAIKIYDQWRALKQEGDSLRQKRNALSQEVNTLKKEGKDIQSLLKQIRQIPEDIKRLEERDAQLQQQLHAILRKIPNLVDKDVPVHRDEAGNRTLRTFGKKPKLKFALKSHVDLLKELDIADVERAAKVSGARFYYLKNELVELDLAIIKFALDTLKKKGYALIRTPDLLRKSMMEGAAELADFEDTLYKISADEELFLIGTAEQTLAALHSNEILASLPLKYAGISECFRREAGAHGKDTKGIFRVHEFRKVEQFVYCYPKDSRKMQEAMIKVTEEIFKKLKLHYRIVSIASGALNDTAIKKYDLEVWMPVQKEYREMVSCSNCTDYQARKLNIRYASKEGTAFPHLLNGTAIATPRILAAILENYQQKDGSINVPAALQKYTGFKKIKRKN